MNSLFFALISAREDYISPEGNSIIVLFCSMDIYSLRENS